METYRISLEALYPSGQEANRTVEAAISSQIGPEIDRWHQLHPGAKIKSEVVLETKRKTTVVPPSGVRKFEVNLRGSLHATKTLSVEAPNEEFAQVRAMAWVIDHGETLANWTLDWADAPSVESIE